MRRVRRVLIFLLAAIGTLQVIVTATPVLGWWTRWLTGPRWEEPKGAVMVVLASDYPSDGVIGYSSYWRAVYAVWAWRGGGVRYVVVSGGEGSGASVRDLLVSQGVPAPAVRLEDRSTSTRENAQFTADLLRSEPPGGRVVLLTSDFHMRRAAACFRRAGIDVAPVPVPDAGKRGSRWRQRWTVFLELSLETAKLALYKARGWV